jgi:hypothetical protein
VRGSTGYGGGMAKRFSEKQRSGFLAKFEHWEGSAAGFCRKHGLSYQSLLNWRRSAASRPRAEEPVGFVEFELCSEPAPPAPPAHSETRRGAVVELELGAGVVLRVYPIQDARP